jgi:uncharacterized protein
MSVSEVKKIVRKYAKKMKSEQYPFSAIYLFGSMAKGTANKWSDIDIAIVTDKIKRNEEKNRLLLWKMRTGIDDRIEPHTYTVSDFKDDTDPIVHEIKTTGIKIA